MNGFIKWFTICFIVILTYVLIRGISDAEFYLSTIVSILILVLLAFPFNRKTMMEAFSNSDDQEKVVQEVVEEEVVEEESVPVGNNAVGSNTRFISFNFKGYQKLKDLPSDVKSLLIPNLLKTFKFMTDGADEEEMDDGLKIEENEKHEIDQKYYESKKDPAVMRNGAFDEEAFGDLSQKIMDCNFALYNLRLYLPDIYNKIVK